MTGSTKIIGAAYGRPASLEIVGDTLTWRAKPDAAENIVTTIHDVRFAQFTSRRVSWPGVGFAALGVVWILGDWYVVGAIAFAVALGLIGLRLAQPSRRLTLEVGANQLVLEVGAGSSGPARELVQRIERAIVSGEMPSNPPMLP